MKRQFVSLALVAAFLGTLVLGAGGASAEHDPNKQVDGARALVDGIVLRVASGEIDITDSAVQVGLVNLDRSLNSPRVLDKVLNNSRLLSNKGIDVVDTVGVGDINDFTLTDAQIGILQGVLTDAQITRVKNFLSFNAHHNPNMDLADAVVAALSSGDLVLIARCRPGSDWPPCTG